MLLYTRSYIQSVVVRLFVILSHRRRHQTADTNEGVYNPISDTRNIKRVMIKRRRVQQRGKRADTEGERGPALTPHQRHHFFSQLLLFETLYTGITIFTCTIIPHHHCEFVLVSQAHPQHTHTYTHKQTRIAYVLYTACKQVKSIIFGFFPSLFHPRPKEWWMMCNNFKGLTLIKWVVSSFFKPRVDWAFLHGKWIV